MNPAKAVAAIALATALSMPPATAQVLRQLTDSPSTRAFTAVTIDDSGSHVVTVSSGDPLGANPEHAFQLFDWDPVAGNATQLSSFDEGVGPSASISDDAAWVAFISPSDLVGANHDESMEAFVMRLDGTDVSQLTSHGFDDGGVLEVLVAGDGSRVILLDDGDPLGTNPQRRPQLFGYELATSTLTQLTSFTTGVFHDFDVSDDGNRIIFSHSEETIGPDPFDEPDVFTLLADGTQLTQRTVAADAVGTWISGDGSTIASTPGGVYRWPRIGPQLQPVGGPLTVDASWVYYIASDDVRRRDVRLGTDELVADTWVSDPDAQTGDPDLELAGDGSRVVYRIAAPGFYGLETATPGGATPQTLGPSDESGAFFREPAISADGSTVVFVETSQTHDVYRVQGDGTGLAWVTEGLHPWINADGSSLVLNAGAGLPDNACELGAIARVAVDGSSIQQLSPANSTNCETAPWYFSPTGSADDSRVAFYRLLGEQSGSMTAPGAGGAATLVLPSGAFYPIAPRLSDDGQWAVFESRDETTASVVRAATDGSSLQYVVDGEPSGGTRYADISGDGQQLVWVSDLDPVGQNADGNSEVVHHDVASGSTSQLTDTTLVFGAIAARISRDGSLVYFESAGPLADSEAVRAVSRIDLSTGVIERIGGLARAAVDPLPLPSQRFNPELSVDHGGDRAVFIGSGDPVGRNRDRSREIFIADYATPARIRVGAAAPTLVEWDVEPAPVRYDVIRGSVAELTIDGASVDLGAVACIEDDSPDNDTVGFEDALQPAPGEVVFYLYRGSQGSTTGPGSYGTGGAGRERIASAGDCT